MRQKSAEGILDLRVGKAIEALQAERWSKQIGQAGNEDTKARTRGAASRV